MVGFVQIVSTQELLNNKLNDRKSPMQVEDRLVSPLNECKLLAQSVSSNTMKSWEHIALNLKSENDQYLKTVTECDQKQARNSENQGKAKKQNQWSSSQLLKLKDLFLEHGLRWTFLTKFFPLRTQNCLKNKFYNSLRKTARKLMDSQSRRIGNSCKSVLTCQMLTIILELCYELELTIKDGSVKMLTDNMLFRVRQKILEIAFSQESTDIPLEDSFKLVKEIRKLNSNLRCFGVYKTKKRKNWNLNSQRLKSVLKVINVENEPILKVEEKLQSPNANKNRKNLDQSENFVPLPQPSQGIDQLPYCLNPYFFYSYPLAKTEMQVFPFVYYNQGQEFYPNFYTGDQRFSAPQIEVVQMPWQASALRRQLQPAAKIQQRDMPAHPFWRQPMTTKTQQRVDYEMKINTGFNNQATSFQGFPCFSFALKNNAGSS